MSATRLTAVDPITGRVGASVALPAGADEGQDSSAAVVINRVGSIAYVIEASFAAGRFTDRIVPVQLPGGQQGAPIAIDGGPDFGVSSATFSADDRMLYLADVGNGDLVPVDLSTGVAEPPIRVGGLGACGDEVTGVAVTPGGQDAYVEGLGRIYDVDLATRASSPGFEAAATYPAGSYGDIGIALDPDGSTLYALQSGQQTDTIVPIDTDGDDAEKAITVPVGDRQHVRRTAGGGAPDWDRLYVPDSSTALVIAYGSDPESVIPVDLDTGAVGDPIAMENSSGQGTCGDGQPVPVAIDQSGTAAVVADAGVAEVHTVDLSSGAESAPIRVAPSGTVLGLLSPDGYDDFVFI